MDTRMSTNPSTDTNPSTNPSTDTNPSTNPSTDTKTRTRTDTKPKTKTGTNPALTVSVNGETREVAPGTRLDAVVASLTAAPSGVAAALNETVVPRAQWASTPLSEGDRVEVLTAVQGG
ncbi:hypothetical protein GCM10009535_29390 [Streptomyces thermocarboxydovorans]|uniref:Thiamine biosynthesis protein ThiS n=1 Tax=Streptomyces thermocarboxydovorans TaxID=59298 RepID=A0ABP3SP34_9ACTN